MEGPAKTAIKSNYSSCIVNGVRPDEFNEMIDQKHSYSANEMIAYGLLTFCSCGLLIIAHAAIRLFYGSETASVKEGYKKLYDEVYGTLKPYCSPQAVYPIPSNTINISIDINGERRQFSISEDRTGGKKILKCGFDGNVGAAYETSFEQLFNELDTIPPFSEMTENFDAFKETYLHVVDEKVDSTKGKSWELLKEKYSKTDYVRAKELLETIDEGDFQEEVSSIRVISDGLDRDAACYVAFNRDVCHYSAGSPSCSEINQELLHTQGSAVRLESDHNPSYIAPNGQVSVLQKTTVYDGNKRVRPHVLSVSPPALDNQRMLNTGEQLLKREIIDEGKKSARPETFTYLDLSNWPPVFKTNNYKTAQDTLGNHIQRAASLCQPERVVLSGYGVNVFLALLGAIDSYRDSKEQRFADLKGNADYKERALNIAAQSFAETIQKLRAQGIEVRFSDTFEEKGYGVQIFWDKVNAQLKALKEPQLDAVNGENSALGEGWIQDTDLIINAWDPDSLVGNGLGKDMYTFDGVLGSMSTCHAVHAAACREYQRTKAAA
jgi:hypothetical protein